VGNFFDSTKYRYAIAEVHSSPYLADVQDHDGEEQVAGAAGVGAQCLVAARNKDELRQRHDGERVPARSSSGRGGRGGGSDGGGGGDGTSVGGGGNGGGSGYGMGGQTDVAGSGIPAAYQTALCETRTLAGAPAEGCTGRGRIYRTFDHSADDDVHAHMHGAEHSHAPEDEEHVQPRLPLYIGLGK
jgi:hypothetical protein